jgi:hypothetical protein
MRAYIIVWRDSVCLDVYGPKGCDAEFKFSVEHIRKCGIICFTGAACSTSFSVAVDCRFPQQAEYRSRWSGRRRAIVGAISMLCVERGYKTEIRSAFVTMDRIDLEKVAQEKKK